MVHVRRRLQAAGLSDADRQARWLIEHALGLSGVRQLVDRSRVVPRDEMARVDALVTRRVAREPLQYILGTQEFCGLEFEVNPAVLIPRPETELLVQEVIRRLPQGMRPLVIEVGTGSGCVAVSFARAVPTAMLFASDLSARALETAKRNASRHGVDTNISWLEGDLLAPLARLNYYRRVTAIMANPPYIRDSEWSGLQPEVSRYEPRLALVAGPKGTEIHKRLLDEAVPYLAPGGVLAMEIGQGQTADICAKIETMSAYNRTEIVPDEAGIDRIVIVHRGT
jgi:release factor glutamine methyltransferase